MALRAVTSAAVIGVAAGTISLSISDCGDSTTHGHVSSISPTSVPQGTKTLVSGSGHVDTTVSDGNYKVNVKALGVSLQTCNDDLCAASKCALPAGAGSIDFRGLSCPQAAGDVTLGFDVSVSKAVPASLAVLEIDITSEGSNGKLLCAKINTSPGLGFVGEDGPGPSGGNPALDIIIGLADGLFDDHSLSDCIANVVETVPSVASALGDLKKALASKNPFKIAKAIKEVRSVLKGLSQGFQQCGANVQDVEELLEVLKEVVPAIVSNLVAAQESLKDGDYEDFGEHLGKVLHVLAAGDGPGSSSEQLTGLGKGNPALDVIAGLADGLFDDHTLSDCIANVLETTPAAASALGELKEALQHKNPFKIRNAIKDVINVAKSIPDQLAPCADNVDDVQELLNTLTEVVPQFVGDIVSAQQSLKEGDYESFGEYIGKSVRIIAYHDGPRADHVIV